MSSGIQWDENRGWTDPANDEPHLGKEADPIGYVLAKPIAAPPDDDLELQWRRHGFARQYPRTGLAANR